MRLNNKQLHMLSKDRRFRNVLRPRHSKIKYLFLLLAVLMFLQYFGLFMLYPSAYDKYLIYTGLVSLLMFFLL
ncbi:hypothetical protein J4405_05205 [Candidatus Woesearchaeota archaeon]|nr:hypothetical protein [Candidatus Woesearchaeota archaeon]